MNMKQANPIDGQVGHRIRLRRMLIGMSQERLGELLGLSFQQVQKYEKGVNRVGAGRLFDIAVHLGAPITYFYEGVSKKGEVREAGTTFDEVAQFVGSDEGFKLVRAFMGIKDEVHRKKLISIALQVIRAAAPLKDLEFGGTITDHISSARSNVEEAEKV